MTSWAMKWMGSALAVPPMRVVGLPVVSKATIEWIIDEHQERFKDD
jgi:hypothetical protein